MRRAASPLRVSQTTRHSTHRSILPALSLELAQMRGANRIKQVEVDRIASLLSANQIPMVIELIS
jgi:hypothetical protein